MQNLSNSENTLLGMVTAAGVAFALQPTLYYKNAAQQGLEWKLFAHPRLLYRGMTASTMAQVGELGLQVRFLLLFARPSFFVVVILCLILLCFL